MSAIKQKDHPLEPLVSKGFLIVWQGNYNESVAGRYGLIIVYSTIIFSTSIN